MLVFHVKAFIRLTQACSPLTEQDNVLLNLLSEQFESLSDEFVLNETHLQFIKDIFSKRFDSIRDTPLDYTFKATEINKLWIDFSCDFAKTIKQSYLQILMPSFTNTVDPITLNKLCDCKDPTKLYCGADGITLYSIEGLLIRLHKQKPALSTYKAQTGPNKFKLRPLTFLELFRIRSKGIVADSFWTKLIQDSAPQWHKKGHVPQHILVSLLKLVDGYFSDTKDSRKSKLVQELLLCSQELQDCSIEDVNCLYGQVISVGERQFYLIDILLECFNSDDPEFTNKLLGLASWLCDYNASFVGKAEDLQSIYNKAQVGSFFTFSQLKTIITQLETSGFLDVSEAIKALLLLMEGKTTIEPSLANAIGEPYRIYWMNIQGTRLDYTRLQDGPNKLWIHLAELLCGAGFIPSNYYKFLMPTITHDNDPVTLAPLTDVPLSHMVLSEDGTNLYNLLNSEKHQRAGAKIFSNPNTVPPIRFTNLERERLQYAHPRFSESIKLAYSEENDPALSLSTVLALRDLINESLHPEGLAGEIDDALMDPVIVAYETFFSRISDDERRKLDIQCIYYNGHNRYFCEILVKIHEKRQCVAINSQYFMQLVLDYAPHEKFCQAIESSKYLNLQLMRKESRKKVCSGIDIDDNEAKRRLLIIMSSLMSRNTQWLKMGNMSVLQAYGDTLTGVTKTLFQELTEIIVSQDFKHARFLYSRIMREAKVAFKGAFWLSSLLSENLFIKNYAWISSDTWLKTLRVILSGKLETFPVFNISIDDLALCMKSHEFILQEIQMNSRFSQLLSSLQESSRVKLLQSLESDVTTSLVDKNSFYKVYADLLIHRSAVFGADGEDQSSPLFFKSFDGVKYIQIKKILTEAVCDGIDTVHKFYDDLCEKIRALPKGLCKDKVRTKMIHYLEQMKGTIPIPIPITCSPEESEVRSLCAVYG